MARDYAWVDPYLERVRCFLGLHAWTLEIHPGEVTTDGMLGDATDAQCHANWPYLDAKITVRPACWLEHFGQPCTGAKLLICHEMLHVLFAGLALGVEEIVNVYQVSDSASAYRLYDNHEEQTIVRFARQIYEALEWHDRQEAENRRLRKRIKELTKS